MQGEFIQNSVMVIYCIDKLTKKNYMIPSIGAEKHLTKLNTES